KKCESPLRGETPFFCTKLPGYRFVQKKGVSPLNHPDEFVGKSRMSSFFRQHLRAPEDRIEHGAGEAACVRILTARVVAAEQRNRRGGRADAEPRLRRVTERRAGGRTR